VEQVEFEPLSGEWTACSSGAAGDHSTLLVFYPDSFSSTTRALATADGTCAGTQTGSSHQIWRYRLTGDAPARIGAAGPEVVAKQMSIENSFETTYTIVYVDGQVTPAQLYLGDLSSDPLRDGTSPQRRPNVLSDTGVFTGR
jgi:hypothetical protein